MRQGARQFERGDYLRKVACELERQGRRKCRDRECVVSRETIRVICHARAEGLRRRELARLFGVSIDSISSWSIGRRRTQDTEGLHAED